MILKKPEKISNWALLTTGWGRNAKDTIQAYLDGNLKNSKITLVIIIKNKMLKAFPNRIVNIHPSLLPSFSGTKMAIQEVLAYGVKITGITTHIIDDKLDEGMILCQKTIKVKPDDTFETLYSKFSKKGITIILKTIKMMEKRKI